MATYYADNIGGTSSGDGLCPERAARDYTVLPLASGDTLLFKCGNRYRDRLTAVPGVRYGAYGEGAKPSFDPSTDVSSPDCWAQTETENVWLCTVPIHGEVGNVIFNGDECTATLRWTSKELCEQGDFWDSRYACGKREAPQTFLLYSHGNPGEVYAGIEVASYGARSCAYAGGDNIFDGICFKNCGVHGLNGSCDNVVIRNCDFLNIGGCAWSVELHVRFGNAVEFWEHGNNITVENCYFKNIYDSCVTHQGPGERTEPAKNFICRSNVFDTYGMAAFEYRDKMTVNSEFTGNVCMNAGCGFAMRGEGEVRLSEIYPEPMGHHIFLWRIDHATEGGSLLIEGNTFGAAPAGAAIYSRISPEAEAQITLKNNRYTPSDRLLIRFGGKNYTHLEEYKTATGKDDESTYI